MCGIAGFQGRFTSELLWQMAAAIAHRGPDDAEMWTDVQVGAINADRRVVAVCKR